MKHQPKIRVLEIIEATYQRGRGGIEDPRRTVRTFYLPNGTVLAEADLHPLPVEQLVKLAIKTIELAGKSRAALDYIIDNPDSADEDERLAEIRSSQNEIIERAQEQLEAWTKPVQASS